MYLKEPSQLDAWGQISAMPNVHIGLLLLRCHLAKIAWYLPMEDSLGTPDVVDPGSHLITG